MNLLISFCLCNRLKCDFMLAMKFSPLTDFVLKFVKMQFEVKSILL